MKNFSLFNLISKVVLFLTIFLLVIQFSCYLVLDSANNLSAYFVFENSEDMISYFKFVGYVVKITPFLIIIFGVLYGILKSLDFKVKGEKVEKC